MAKYKLIKNIGQVIGNAVALGTAYVVVKAVGTAISVGAKITAELVDAVPSRFEKFEKSVTNLKSKENKEESK